MQTLKKSSQYSRGCKFESLALCSTRAGCGNVVVASETVRSCKFARGEKSFGLNKLDSVQEFKHLPVVYLRQIRSSHKSFYQHYVI